MAAQANITRRSALSTLSAIPLVASLPAIATAASPVDRFHAAVAELKASAEALDPNIYDWTISTNGDLACGLVIAAFRTTTKYEGDGWYEEPTATGKAVVWIERAPECDRNGQLWFRATRQVADRNGRRFSAVMSEQTFTTSYCKKISI